LENLGKKSDIHDGVGLFFCGKSNIPDYSGTNSFFYALIFKTSWTDVTGYNNYYDTEKKAEGSNGCTYWVITKTQQIDFTFIDTANENRNFRVNYSLDRIGKKFATVNFHMPSNDLLYGQFFSYFYRLDKIDSIKTMSGNTLIGSYIDSEKKWFYSRDIGFALFTDQFQNKWTILN